MGNRLSRIVTRTGDKGTTGLGSGARVEKDSPTIEALGTIDELNSWIGVLSERSASSDVRQVLTYVQHDLFDLGAQVSVPGTALLSEAHLERIENATTALNADLPPLKEFILPGGAQIAAFTHVARTVCRRAERRLISLRQVMGRITEAGGTQSAVEGEYSYGLAYLNRLSDLLFIISRVENRADGRQDVFWQRGASLSSQKEP